MNFKIKLNWILKWLVLIVGLSGSNNLYAIGLGELTVNSYLNEPLNADLVIIGAKELDHTNFQVEVASSEDFKRAGIPRVPLLSQLKFEIKKVKNVPTVHIYTTRVIKEPFLDFLLQLTWLDGSIIKSYTILLDPSPNYDGSEHAGAPSHSLNLANNGMSKDHQKPHELTINGHLNESIENELLFKPESVTKAHKILGDSSSKTSSNLHKNSKDEFAELSDKIALQSQENFSNGLLNKVAYALQSFSANNKSQQVSYEKLLDLNPNAMSLTKEEQKLAQQNAINQINSELNILRNSNDPSKDPTGAALNAIKESVVADSTVSGNNLNNFTTIQPNHNGNNNSNPKTYNVHYVEANQTESNFKLNDLLWALFLVSTTMVMFYKIISYHVKPPQTNDFQIASNDLVDSTAILNNSEAVCCNQANSSSNDLSSNDLSSSKVMVENNYVSSNFTFVRNEELELKISLANQYIEAGDRKSAQELLQEIINVKEEKYRNKITAMLKAITI